MREEVTGFGLAVNGHEFILAFSLNVFTLGLEFYPSYLAVRLGPIAFFWERP